jgi:hypothetical protein
VPQSLRQRLGFVSFVWCSRVFVLNSVVYRSGFAAMIMTRSTEIHQHFLSPFLREQRGERAI